jgi:hypothetical protein
MRDVPNTEGTDAEVLSFVIAVDVNEIWLHQKRRKRKSVSL